MSKYTAKARNAPYGKNNEVMELPYHIAAALIETFIAAERILDSGSITDDDREELTVCRNTVTSWLDT